MRAEGDARRKVSGWLILGVITLPGLFVWLTLRRGYARDVRTSAFLLAAMSAVFGIVGHL